MSFPQTNIDGKKERKVIEGWVEIELENRRKVENRTVWG